MKIFLLLPLVTTSVPFLPLSLKSVPNFGLTSLEIGRGSPLLSRGGGEMAATRQSDVSRVCLTDSCIETAARLLRQMDRTADPCQDFYQFACGGFLENTVLPDHKTRLGSYDLLRDELNRKLKALFEAESDDSEPRIYKDVRNLYKSCMDTERIELRSVTELRDLLDRLGGWPVVEGEDWRHEDFTWHDLSIRASREGMDTGRIMNIGIGTNPADSERRMIKFDQFSPGLSREYLIKGFDDDDVQAYYNYMINMAVLLGADRERARVELKESLMLELKLVEFALPREKRRNKTALHNPMALSEVQKLYPEFPMESYINTMIDYEPSNVDSSEIVNVAVPTFISQVRDLLATVPARVQANYMMWRNVKSQVSYLNDAALDIGLQYVKALVGKNSLEPRWEKCVKSAAGLGSPNLFFTEGSLTNAVGAMYAKKYFDLHDKQVADEMVENIRATFRILLEEVDWMDDKTKAKALEKADKITPHVAYAKEILNDDLVNEFYDDLELQGDSYLQNVLKLKKHINLYYAKQFRKPIIKNDWRTHGGAAVVNAFYDSSENSIQFPAAVLGGVFFGAERPQYMNYGCIGYTVGHEITHGFDDGGSQKDGDGNLVDWWEEETKEKYLERAQCIIDQYGNYSVKVGEETFNLNGINTQGENIADNGGIKEALLSYISLGKVSRLGPEPNLPGLPFTGRQLFWVSGASKWCSVSRPQSIKNQILTGVHSPSNFRVNGPFSNLVQFSEDWQCPLGSPMNPVKKCTVW